MTTNRIKSRRTLGNGFTLVELLVVIGIIALLISILLPSLNKARQAAKTATCLSNLHQVNLGLTMYVSTNKGSLPYYIWNGAFSSDPKTNANIHWHGYWIGMLGDLKMPTSALLCPEANEPAPLATGSFDGGMVHTAWTGANETAGTPLLYTAPARVLDAGKPDPAFGSYRIGSYGINANICRADSTDLSFMPQTNFFGNHVTAMRESADTPTFFDSLWVDVFLRDPSSATALLAAPSDLSGKYAWGAGASVANGDAYRALITRHGYAINMAFADGHVSTVPLTDVFNHRWTAVWYKQQFKRGAAPAGLPPA